MPRLIMIYAAHSKHIEQLSALPTFLLGRIGLNQYLAYQPKELVTSIYIYLLIFLFLFLLCCHIS